MKTYEECRTFRERHREQMAARAESRGRGTLAPPHRDACAALVR